MAKPRIIVTGAMGRTGRLVAAELVKAGYPVRAMVYREVWRRERAIDDVARPTTPITGKPLTTPGGTSQFAMKRGQLL